MNGHLIIGIIIIAIGGFAYFSYVKSRNITFLDYKYDLYFEPENPITTPQEFSQEIIEHFSKENQFVSIVTESMEPRIQIDDEEYFCRLGRPFRTWRAIKVPINPFAGDFLGYKWVYIYKVKKHDD